MSPETSALQPPQVQISLLTIKKKKKKTPTRLHTSKLVGGILDFNKPEGKRGGNTRCINAPVSQDQSSGNLRRSQRGKLPQSFKKKKKVKKAKQMRGRARLRPDSARRRAEFTLVTTTAESRQERAAGCGKCVWQEHAGRLMSWGGQTCH